MSSKSKSRMNNRYVRFLAFGSFTCVRVRRSELPEDVYFNEFSTFYAELAPKVPLQRMDWGWNRRGTEARNSAGHCKVWPRGGKFWRYNDRKYVKSPWQHVSKLHWRHSGKAKTFAHRTSRRKAKILLQNDPEGDTNFRANPGLTNWTFF